MRSLWRHVRVVVERPVEIGLAMAREWREDRVGGLAAEVAFFGLLSLFPALLAVAAALSSLEAIAGGDVASRVEEGVVDFLERILTQEASGTIDAVRTLFVDSSPGTFTIGAAVAIWAASRGFVAVINGLDVVYDLDERRSYVGLRALALALALGTVVVVSLILAMVVLGPLLGGGREVADHIGAGELFATLWTWARWPLVVVVMVVWAATVFHIAPNHRTPWRWDLPGAALAAVLWGLLSAGFRIYLAVAAEANQVMGTLGGALIVLLWFYLLAVGLLLGGELNAILAARHGVAQVARQDP